VVRLRVAIFLRARQMGGVRITAGGMLFRGGAETAALNAADMSRGIAGQEGRGFYYPQEHPGFAAGELERGG